MAKSTGKKGSTSKLVVKAVKPTLSLKKASSNGRAPVKSAAAVKAPPSRMAAKPVKKNNISAMVEKSVPPSKSAKPAARSAPVVVSRSARSAKPPVAPAPVVVPPPMAESVPTNDKPRKNQVGFNSKDLEFFRDLLLAKRRELVGDMSAMEREALRTSGGTNLSTLPIHMADMGTDNYEQEFTLGLVEKDRNLLREINSALAKIQNGTFGMCEATGNPIGRPRLEAQPWARFSIEHARQLEKRGGRG